MRESGRGNGREWERLNDRRRIESERMGERENEIVNRKRKMEDRMRETMGEGMRERMGRGNDRQRTIEIMLESE